VREQSHLDEMRDAIRGDFERLAERRGEQELLQVAEPGTEREPEEAGVDEPEPEALPQAESELETEPDAEPEPAEEEPSRWWLGRLLSP
jgi:hypothetical protein